MDTQSLLKDARAEQFSEKLGFQTECGKTRFALALSKPLERNVERLRDFQKTILTYRNLSSQTLDTHTKCFATLQTLEPRLQTLVNPSALEKESIEQITFSKSDHFKLLNTIPYLLAFISIWKQYIVPALACLMPLFFFFLPFLTMKVLYGLPITFSEYIHIFCMTLGIPSDMSKLELRQGIQLLFTSISLGQSIYQPIQNSYHIQKIDQTLLQTSDVLFEFQKIVKILLPDKSFLLDDISQDDKRRAFAFAWDLPFRIQILLTHLGDCEVLHRLAICPTLTPVLFTEKPILTLTNVVDPLLESSIPLSIQFSSKKHHCVLTGPNGGGKSTALRCILLNVLVAQRFGVCFSEKGGLRLKPFDWIQSGLHLEDTPGELSLFEREVRFASSAIQRAREFPEQRGLLLFDELFHSTNPPDGERTATLFLHQVWDFSSVTSLISTHVFALAESAPPFVQRLCVPAEKTSDGVLKFSYRLQPGICRVSSVDRVLQKCGFFPPGKPPREKE